MFKLAIFNYFFGFIILNVEREVIEMVQKQFGERIKELRKERNLSQEKFALSIGMDRTYYSSVETGNRNVSIENIKKIADGFHISLEELFKGM